AMDVFGAGRKRQRQTPNTVLELYERLFYTACRGHADRVSRRALQERPEPGQGDGLQVVAEPLHGLRAPVYVLLRQALRAPLGPALRRSLRNVDPREDERRGSPRARACSWILGARARGRRRSDGSLPTGRGQVQADARLPR